MLVPVTWLECKIVLYIMLQLSYVGKGSVLQPLEPTPTTPSPEETTKSKSSG